MIPAFYDWAAAQVPAPVIWAHQDGGQPAQPFVTLHLIADAREGQAAILSPDEDGITHIRHGQLLTLSVNVIGDHMTGTIQTLRDSLEKLSVQRDLRVSGYAFVQVLSGPQDIPSITGSTWQQRAQMDIQFRTSKAISDDLGVIEQVTIIAP